MSDFCPCCDNFSIDSSIATRGLVEKSKKKKIVINVDNSTENADWIKYVRGGKVESSHKDLNKGESV